MGPPVSLFHRLMCQQCNGLNCLAEAHLVRQDAVQLAVAHISEPVKPNVLIRSQCRLQEIWNLCLHVGIVEARWSHGLDLVGLIGLRLHLFLWRRRQQFRSVPFCIFILIFFHLFHRLGGIFGDLRATILSAGRRASAPRWPCNHVGVVTSSSSLAARRLNRSFARFSDGRGTAAGCTGSISFALTIICLAVAIILFTVCIVILTIPGVHREEGIHRHVGVGCKFIELLLGICGLICLHKRTLIVFNRHVRHKVDVLCRICGLGSLGGLSSLLGRQRHSWLSWCSGGGGRRRRG
mmetsp:Transcript_21868/g.65389  ORF Transcript_21868/g.65389 Transcript_21868/m.65389 type:complete len:294 (-) Transcript_21868:472-1353(-)